MKVLVSSCLLGRNCKYNGGNNYNEKVIEFLKDKEVVEFCPEVMAGMPVPRTPIEMLNGNLISEDGKDMNIYKDRAIEIVDELIKNNDFDLAILKSRSPSCGYKCMYDGTFTHTKVSDSGYACKEIEKHNIKIITEEDL